MKKILVLFFVLFYCTRDYCVAHPTRTTPFSQTTEDNDALTPHDDTIPSSQNDPDQFWKITELFKMQTNKAAHTTSTLPTADVSISSPENKFYDGSIKSTTSTITSTTTVSTTTAQDDLDDISIQDILSSDIDANDKIEKKIINAISEFSSNCNIYKRVELSLSTFVFPKNTINVDLGTGNASFYNFVIKEESDTTSNKRKWYSTLIGCDSSIKAKVEVAFPNNIKITANVKVEEIADSSNGFVSKSISEGSITILLKNNSILKQFVFQSDDRRKDEDEITKKLSYFRTELSLDLDTKYQKVIYKNLEVFLNELESSLEQFFVDKLSAELAINGILVGQSCSKFIGMENNSKKINLPFFKNDLNNLYVLSNVSQETWKGARLSAGPVVIQGLSHFNNTELIVSGTELSTSGTNGYYQSTPRPDDPERKQITVRIKTNGLKGKLNWSYNLKPRSFSFNVDFITFEVKKNKNYQYSRRGYNYYDNDYIRSEQNNIDTNVYVGDIQIKSSKLSVCENEKEFVNFVLSEYLKTVLKDSLKNSLAKKFQNDNFVVNYC